MGHNPLMPLTPFLSSQIAAIVRDTANEILVPAAARIKDIGIEEKGPNDFVTEADKQMEEVLTQRLQPLVEGSQILGEESAYADPTLIDRMLATDAPLWIIDPLDGTANFINQIGGYGPIVALLDKGEVLGCWIYDVTRGDDGLTTLDNLHKSDASLRDRPLGNIGGRMRAAVERCASAPFYDIMPRSLMSCEAYRQLLDGDIDFILYRITEPWDHYAGLALAQKAGFVTLQWTGAPVTFSGRNNGLIVARTTALAERLLNDVVTRVTDSEGLPYAA